MFLKMMLYLLLMFSLLGCDDLKKRKEINSSSIKEEVINNWQFLKEGMSEAEVLHLLGKPMKKKVYEGGYESIYYYGELVKKCSSYPEGINAEVQFINGKLIQYENVSLEDSPLKLLFPDKKMIFSHFPRYVDLRWIPVLSKKFNSYRLQVDLRVENGKWQRMFLVRADVPYYCFSAGGASLYRWRVQGINKDRFLEGKWSQWREFEFKR